MKPPKILDKVADVVLAYRPKPKSKPAKKVPPMTARAKVAMLFAGMRARLICLVRGHQGPVGWNWMPSWTCQRCGKQC